MMKFLVIIFYFQYFICVLHLANFMYIKEVIDLTVSRNGIVPHPQQLNFDKMYLAYGWASDALLQAKRMLYFVTPEHHNQVPVSSAAKWQQARKEIQVLFRHP